MLIFAYIEKGVEKCYTTSRITKYNSFNQLSREARILRLVGSDKKKLLLLLADDLACAKTIQRTKIIDGVQ